MRTLWPKRATIEEFRDRVYQPRIALIILVCILGSSALDELNGGSSSRHHDDKPARASPPPGAFIRVPNISVESFVTKETMPPLVQLHALWMIRFVVMMIEDHFEMMSLQRRISPPRFITFNLMAGSLVLLALATAASSLGARMALESLCPSSSNDHVKALLPLRGIVAVEYVITCLTVLMPWVKLDPFLSSHIRLPSPSHAPSIAEALHLPDSIAAMLTGQVVVAPAPPTNTILQPRGAGLGGGEQRQLQATRARQGVLAPIGQMPLQAPPQDSARRAARREAAGTQEEDASVNETAEPAAPRQPEQRSELLQNPLRLQSPAQADPKRAGKAPRQQGIRVSVELPWFLETALALANRTCAAIQYILVVISLPSLSPTSLPPLLALLALRWELSDCANTWTSARSSIECLEFVLRRWNGDFCFKKLAEDSSSIQSCAICFEPVYADPHSSDITADTDITEQHFRRKGCCKLDCGHQLHPTCLCAWLGKQAFCPVCHLALSATPPGVSTHPNRTPTANPV